VIGVDEYARRAGPDISRATVDGWLMKVGELLTPLAAVMRDELLRGSYIKADETSVAVQTSDGRPKLSCISLRIWSAGRRRGLRVPHVAWARRAGALP
jgi:hypothetical protein